MVSNTFKRIRALISEGRVRISEHGYDELAAEGLLARELVEGVKTAELVEDYPTYPKGPCVLLLQRTEDGRSVHAVWGLPAGPYESSSVDYCVLTRSREMGVWIQEEAKMNKKERTKLVHEGNYVAEVDVELLEEPEGWAPYLSLEDAYRLDEVREALRRGDIKTAAKYSRVFNLTPVTSP